MPLRNSHPTRCISCSTKRASLTAGAFLIGTQTYDRRSGLAARCGGSTRGKPRLALSLNLQSCPTIGAPQGTPIKTGGTGNDGYEPVPPCREGGVTMPLPPWRGRAYAAGATIALSGGVRGLPARTPGARSLAISKRVCASESRCLGGVREWSPAPDHLGGSVLPPVGSWATLDGRGLSHASSAGIGSR
jgi:hypothetical protein